MKVFVAGPRGVVGRRLVPMLVEAGHEVVGLSRTPDGRWRAREARDPRRGRRRARPGRMVEVLRPSAPRPSCSRSVASLDRCGPGHTREQFAQSVLVRAIGARNVVEAARAAGTRRVVAQSYAHIYAPQGAGSRRRASALNLGRHVPEDRRRNVEAVVALEDAVCDTPGIEGVALRYGSLYGPCTAFDWDGVAGRARPRAALPHRRRRHRLELLRPRRRRGPGGDARARRALRGASTSATTSPPR